MNSWLFLQNFEVLSALNRFFKLYFTSFFFLTSFRLFFFLDILFYIDFVWKL